MVGSFAEKTILISSSVIEKISRPSYFWLAALVYADYVLIGTGQIAVAQHMDAFMLRLMLDAQGIAWIIAATSFGRAFGGVFSGFLSDRFGRRPVILAGTTALFLSFAGMVCAHEMHWLFIAVFCGGLGSSLIDSGAFAVLAEAFPKTAASTVVGTKIGIAFGQIFFPWIVVTCLNFEVPQEMSLAVAAVAAIVNLICFTRIRFPKFVPARSFFKASPEAHSQLKVRHPVKFVTEGIPLFAFAGLSYICFGVVMIWMPLISRELASVSMAQSLTMVSFFAAGAVTSGVGLIVLMRRLVRPVWLMVILPLVTMTAAGMVYLFPSVWMCRIASFVIGTSAASGVLQIGVTLLMEFFPRIKARLAMCYMVTSSLTAALITKTMGALVQHGMIEMLMAVNAVAALLCAVVGLWVFLRFYKVFEINSPRLGEAFLIKHGVASTSYSHN